MIESLVLGFSSGALLALLCYLFFVKIFPPDKLLKMNWILGIYIVFAVTFFEALVMGIFHGLFVSLTVVKQGSIDEHLFLLPMIYTWAGSVIFFGLIPILKAKRALKNRE